MSSIPHILCLLTCSPMASDAVNSQQTFEANSLLGHCSPVGRVRNADGKFETDIKQRTNFCCFDDHVCWPIRCCDLQTNKKQKTHAERHLPMVETWKVTPKSHTPNFPFVLTGAIRGTLFKRLLVDDCTGFLLGVVSLDSATACLASVRFLSFLPTCSQSLTVQQSLARPQAPLLARSCSWMAAGQRVKCERYIAELRRSACQRPRKEG